MSTPSIALIPSGYKEGKVYSQLPINGDGDLTFSRTGTSGVPNATRVNEQGLIEDVNADVPRLDYSDGGCPVLLLEPQSTNLVNYSSDFTQWGQTRTSVSANVATSPKGDLTGSLIVPDTQNGQHSVLKSSLSSDNGTYSVYVKADGYSAIRINGGSSGNGYADFDTVTESILNSGGTYFQDAKINDEGNGWYRCSLTLSTGSGDNRFLILVLNELNQTSYIGDGTSGVYVWHGQLEVLTEATSPIETDGQTETRNADVATLDTTGLNLTSITETFSDNSTNVITPVPTTYTVSQGRIKQIIGE